MKMWIARNQDGSLWLHEEKPSLVYDEELRCWHYECGSFLDFYDESIFHEVTFENSPQEFELKIKHNEMHFSPMFRLFDKIVIKNPSDRKWIVKYIKKLIDKLKEEGFYADAKCAEEYLKIFNGELVELVIKK